MPPIILIDGNNLGHVLGYIDKATGHYDNAGLLACLDGVVRYLAAQGQAVDMVLFLDDVRAAERLGGWHVRVAPVPGGHADAAIASCAEEHAGHPQILVSDDRALCGDVAVWGGICLSSRTFISHYVIPARQASFVDRDLPVRYVEEGEGGPATMGDPTPPAQPDQGIMERQRQAEALVRAEATLRGETLPQPEVYRLDLARWADEAELALYLAEHHLCPDHPDLTIPQEMIAAIREHCSRQPRYFTAGPIVDRVFRLFLCRPEHTLSLDDLAHWSQTRRRKVRATLKKYRERLGIVVA